MKRLTSIALLLVAAMVVFVGVHFGWHVYSIPWRAVAGPAKRPLRDVTFERTEARRARGEYLAEGLLACFSCHSDRDWTQPGAPIIASKKGAGHVFVKEGSPYLVAPNITPDPETGAGAWTDDMLARAIREGIGHDGRGLHPRMPYRSFSQLSDEDVASVIVYLRGIPAVRNSLPRTLLPFSRRITFNQIPEPITQPRSARAFATVKDRGEALEYLADCAGCHTDWYNSGSAVNGKLFAGGNALLDGTGQLVFSANLTPGPSGISYKDADVFVDVIRTGKMGGHQLNGVMPWEFYRNLSDDDLKAIFVWLQAQDPIQHIIDNAAPPTFCKRCNQKHGGGELN